jgi:hypothetical protein
LLALIVAGGACSREPHRAFRVGLLDPVSPRLAAEARRIGLEIAAQAPAGAAVVSAAVPLKKGEFTGDWARLRFLTAQAVAAGSSGVFLRLARTPAGQDLLDYPEEWQAVARVSRELLSMQAILQSGAPVSVPFAVPTGLESRAWASRGRRYVLLVNNSDQPQPLEYGSLAPWRSLFSVRSDARQILRDCGADHCLAPGGVLWLEGRLFPDILR